MSMKGVARWRRWMVSLQIAATAGALQVGAAQGVPLTLLPLPYALLEDI